MALFNRRKNSREESNGDGDHSSEGKKEKGGWRKPANTAFKQQRLKAWQPILTPKTVLPILFLIGIIFGPIGGLLIWGNDNVSQITLPYTDCDKQGPTFSNLPDANYQLRSSDSGLSPSPPLWTYNSSSQTCTIQFELPADLQKPVFLYYKLTNFFQNHRRYVQSLNTDQLRGKFVSFNTLKGSTCKPLDVIGNQSIYPCGLIANSQFNDSIQSPFLLNTIGDSNSSSPYNFSATGIAWPGEAKKYTSAPNYPSLSDIVPPPNWMARYPNGYTNATPPPDLRADEQFQNWMRTAGLPTFSKLWGRNDTEDMVKGMYNISIQMNFPVTEFGGTKSLVISTIQWSGGKNAFLGWAYVGASALFVLLAVLGTARHLIRPRRLGDMNLLSWNQPATVR
ncbi:transcription regulator [Gautieria morchelliformis]|nr:transcription regulator [Gautieria morchelliformis]